MMALSCIEMRTETGVYTKRAHGTGVHSDLGLTISNGSQIECSVSSGGNVEFDYATYASMPYTAALRVRNHGSWVGQNAKGRLWNGEVIRCKRQD
jgi:hypothetical protein